MWLGRVACALTVALIVVVCVGRAQPETAPADPGFCAALRVIAEPALYDRVPPPGAPPELEEFVAVLNVEIGLVRRQIEEACRG